MVVLQSQGSVGYFWARSMVYERLFEGLRGVGFIDERIFDFEGESGDSEYICSIATDLGALEAVVSMSIPFEEGVREGTLI